LEALAQRSKPVVVRFPIIPEINDDGENIRQMVALLSRFDLRRIHLLPYHQTGADKYKRLGLGFRLQEVKAPPSSLVARIAGEFERAGFKVKVGG
jgi:pyruvate formate lyase activating enzyme